MSKCALIKQVGDSWIPVAIRYHRFTKRELKELNAGQVVVKNCEHFRRSDWAERAVEFLAMTRALNLLDIRTSAQDGNYKGRRILVHGRDVTVQCVDGNEYHRRFKTSKEADGAHSLTAIFAVDWKKA